MNFTDIIALEKSKVIEMFQENAIENEDHIAEYKNERTQRDTQVGNRKDKTVKEQTVEVNKIPIPFQKQIVQTSAAFLFGKPVQLIADEDINELETAWKSIRIDGLLLKCCEQAKAFRQSALLFRIVKDELNGGLKLSVHNLDPRKGTMYPNFDDFDNLDGFMWNTKVKNESGKEVDRYYIFDQSTVRVWEGSGEDLVETQAPTKHFFDRMPIVYLEEEEVEYESVKHLIDRFENRFSRFADTNDYFSSPFFKATGNIDNVPTRDETGSIYMMDLIETPQGQIIPSDLDVVGWDSAPESTKLEFEITKALIYDLSATPDLSLNNLKGIGNVSGIALKLMFLNSIIKASFNEAIYKPFVERSISVLRSGIEGAKLGTVSRDIYIDVKFTSILPENLTEIIENLSTATMNKPIMSQETALEHNPLVSDTKGELDRIKAESSESLGETFNLPQ
jgi:SPP1 family phage portal protein